MIHSIYSNLPGFKTLQFHDGLNVVIAQKSEGATSKQTRNRAGKTSLIETIHFLLGADAGKESLFRTEALLNSTFGMVFDLGKTKVTAERSGASKSKIDVSGISTAKQRLSNSEWIEILGREMFGLAPKADDEGRTPSFRASFAYFVRRQLSGAFTTPEKQAAMQGVGDYQIALMFLMGLDWKIARDWQVVRDRERTLEELKKAAGTGALGSIIGKAADLRTQLAVAEARLGKLHEEVAAFHVLPEYRNLEREADNLNYELREHSNCNTIDLAVVRDLKTALESEDPPAFAQLESLYEEAGVALPELIKKRYEDVQSFHESVVRNRRDYLKGELEAAESRIEVRGHKTAKLRSRMSELMQILRSHGALDQFVKLQGEVGRLESEVEILRQRFEAAEKLEGTKNELEIERNRLVLRLRRDFVEQKDNLSAAILAYEETSRQLYESAGSMLIEETSNGPLFKFPIQGSRSKGIKNMQMFCFDMMLMRLCAQRSLGPRFLVHDSHLFDGVDGRQVISALRVGAQTAADLGFQYIVTMNEDDAFKEEEEGFDLNQYILPVRLTDATEDGGLFGRRFD